MRTEYKCIQKIFQKRPHILFDEKKVGEISYKGFLQNISNIRLHDYHYQFKRKGNFSSIIDIINLNKNLKVGTIKFHSWITKVTVRMNNHEYVYKQINSWKGIWELYLNETRLISTKGKMYSGNIRDYHGNEELVIITLFMRDFLSKQMMMIA